MSQWLNRHRYGDWYRGHILTNTTTDFQKTRAKNKKKTKMGESFDAVGIGIYFGSYKDMLL